MFSLCLCGTLWVHWPTCDPEWDKWQKMGELYSVPADYHIIYLFIFCQASELALFIQNQRDLGCLASHVVHLQEGMNSDSSAAADFWSLLGGRTQYRGWK